MGNEKGRESIQISVTNIGSGLTLTLPGTSNEQLAALKAQYPSDKFQTLESLATPWTASFLEEAHLSGREHPIQGHIHLTQEGGLIRASASLTFSPELECVRCLETFREPLLSESEAIFVDETRTPGQASSHGRGKQRAVDEEELELQASDLESYPFRGIKVQLDEYLLDALQTALPDLPLCAEGCRGLCSQCGTNLNTEDGEHRCRASK